MMLSPKLFIETFRALCIHNLLTLLCVPSNVGASEAVVWDSGISFYLKLLSLRYPVTFEL